MAKVTLCSVSINLFIRSIPTYSGLKGSEAFEKRSVSNNTVSPAKGQIYKPFPLNWPIIFVVDVDTPIQIIFRIHMK